MAYGSGINVTDVSTTQRWPLGQTFTQYNATTDCMEKWLYVQANGDLVEGKVCTRGAGAATLLNDVIPAPTNSNSLQVCGVAQHTIADDSYGFILRKGVGEVLAGTETIDANEGVYVSATDAGTGMEEGSISGDVDEALPFAWSSEAVAKDSTATCWINCLG